MKADYKNIKAFSLIEAVFALSIFASVVVGIYGLLAIALSSLTRREIAMFAAFAE